MVLLLVLDVYFGPTADCAQELFLALWPEITPNCERGTICIAGNPIQVIHMQDNCLFYPLNFAAQTQIFMRNLFKGIYAIHELFKYCLPS